MSLNDTSGPVDTFSVTFSPGSDFSSSFTIEIIPDNTYEGIEYFVLEIVDIKEPDGFPGNLQVGTRSKVTVTVLDTDGEPPGPHWCTAATAGGLPLNVCTCVCVSGVCVVLRIAFTEKAVELKEGESVLLMGVTAVNPFSVEVEVGVQCLELMSTGARPGRSAPPV